MYVVDGTFFDREQSICIQILSFDRGKKNDHRMKNLAEIIVDQMKQYFWFFNE